MTSTDSSSNSTSVFDSSKCDKHYFPIPYFLFFCGYVMILMVDRIIMKHSHSHSHDEHEHDHEHEHTHKNEQKQ